MAGVKVAMAGAKAAMAEVKVGAMVAGVKAAMAKDAIMAHGTMVGIMGTITVTDGAMTKMVCFLQIKSDL